jgi:acetyl esterase/lipase
VIAVNCRCAPAYPFPTPVEDGADAILHISREAEAFGIDPQKLFISGFSAGGNLAFTSYLLTQSPRTWNYPAFDPPRIQGIVGFYPVLDFTVSRKDKKATSVKPEASLPDFLTSLFDQSYLHPVPHDLRDARLSPAQASDEHLQSLPPVHLCCCEHDMLMAEGKRFHDRLLSMNKRVTWRLVEGEAHAWDKGTAKNEKPTVQTEYDQAMCSILTWLGEPEKARAMAQRAD